MATRVLCPHDILQAPDATLAPRRKSTPKPHRRPEARKQRERSPKPAKAVGPSKGATSKQGPPPPQFSEVYAGSGFANSPAPSSLPLPSFSSLKKDAPAVGEYFATVALRRMLRLE
ncbi:hypothetical protein Cni_G25262 [Canna indica]|uniref:Uncharacterized protein n=1 Tax=Canna indica TaxID=4628 RepID=A0AAQ3KXM5_9LILI|nr:hypothetical protein Cni_G25262 [Canna indica]